MGWASQTLKRTTRGSDVNPIEPLVLATMQINNRNDDVAVRLMIFMTNRSFSI